MKEEKEEDIQIAQRIIADVKALLTCVPYLSSAPKSLLIRLLASDNRPLSFPPIGVSEASLLPIGGGWDSLVANSTR